MPILRHSEAHINGLVATLALPPAINRSAVHPGHDDRDDSVHGGGDDDHNNNSDSDSDNNSDNNSDNDLESLIIIIIMIVIDAGFALAIGRPRVVGPTVTINPISWRRQRARKFSYTQSHDARLRMRASTLSGMVLLGFLALPRSVAVLRTARRGSITHREGHPELSAN